jgi:hypothetical protein
VSDIVNEKGFAMVFSLCIRAAFKFCTTFVIVALVLSVKYKANHVLAISIVDIKKFLYTF